MSRLPLDQVDAFVTAARLRNLTRAAEAMHLTVSALSHRMRLLEQSIGDLIVHDGISLLVGGEYRALGAAPMRDTAIRSSKRC